MKISDSLPLLNEYMTAQHFKTIKGENQENEQEFDKIFYKEFKHLMLDFTKCSWIRRHGNTSVQHQLMQR